MSDTKTDNYLAWAFARISRAAARKKIYARKALKEGRPEVALFLRATAASETVQARRLFNSLVGRIDKSDRYLATIFEEEVGDILASYLELIENGSAERTALTHALTQLRAAETRLRSFYSSNDKDIHIDNFSDYFVCRFCGYLATDNPPEKCPVCGAPIDAFDKIV